MKINEIYGEPLPTNLNNELNRLSKLLEDTTKNFAGAAKEFANKEHAYRKAKAINYLGAEGTVEARKAKVDQACEQERLEAYIARANKEAAKELVLSYRAQLSALQSVAASIRSEMEMAGSPQPKWS
jgi:DNA-binding protein YbaB